MLVVKLDRADQRVLAHARLRVHRAEACPQHGVARVEPDCERQ